MMHQVARYIMFFKGFILIGIMLLFVFPFFSLVSVSFAQNAQDAAFSTEPAARLAITAAEEKIIVCYEAVANADRAGAVTATMLTVLNSSGELLSKAKLAYRMEDFDSARDLALEIQEELSSFVAEATDLEASAIKQVSWDFMVNVVGSIVGTAILISGSFVIWHFLKRRYEKSRQVV